MIACGLLLLFGYLRVLGAQPLVLNSKEESRKGHLSEDGHQDLGTNLYAKLDEAAQRALDLAKEAKDFAIDVEKTQVKHD